MTKSPFYKIICLALAILHLSMVCFDDIALAKSSSSSSAKSSSSKTTQQNSNSAKASSQSAPIKSMSSSGGYSTTDLFPAAHVSGASSFNFGSLSAFQSDPFTGKAAFSVPIACPAARKSNQPSVALCYSSGSGNGILGLGWSLELGSIERSTKRGAPKYDASDKFIFASGGSQTELVPISASEYRAKIEGAFMRFKFDGARWIVIDKSGTKYLFGQSSYSRLEEGSKVYKWLLDKVVDVRGNYLSIAYYTDTKQPKIINYGGNETQSLPHFASIEFTYEDRPDMIISYRSGFKIEITKRLSAVTSKFKGKQFSKYRINYSLSLANRSLITSITSSGADGLSLPPVSFEYYEEQKGWQAQENVFPADSVFDIFTRALDVNNDCRPELLQYAQELIYRGYSNTFIPDKNLNWLDSPSDWKPPVVFGRNSAPFWRDDGVQFADINGDGWQDIVKSFHNQVAEDVSYREVYLNNRNNGWTRDTNWSLPAGTDFVLDWSMDIGDNQTYEMTKSLGVLLVDVNGDGLPDIEKAGPTDASENIQRYSYLNTGSGWERNSAWDLPEGNIADGSIQFCDLNADGLVDFFIVDGASSRGYINTGNGWQRDTNYNIDLSFADKRYFQFCDFNADGLADILIANASMNKAFINTGSSPNTWVENNLSAAPLGIEFGSWNIRIIDLKGRGFADIAVRSTNTVYLNKNTVPCGYLKKIANGVGGETEITYKPSSEFDNTDTSGIQGLPFPVYVVSSVATRDTVQSVNPDMTVTYEYKAGLFDFADREFRGFGYVKTIDPEGNYTESFFKQDDIYKGRPYKQLVKDKNGKLYSKTENIWRHPDPEPVSGVFFPYLAETDNYIYDGNTLDEAGFKKKTIATFEYDSYGNPTKVFSSGDSSLSGDEKTQITEYTYNKSSWILGLPKHSLALGADGTTKVSEKWFYYDENSSIDTAPVKGSLTKEETRCFNPLTGNEKRVNTKFAYDEYGNLQSVIDSLGREVTYTEYDSLLHLFPVRTTNKLGQSVRKIYYGINESREEPVVGFFGLPGQLKYTRDPNNNISYNIYDSLGRLIKVIGPLDYLDRPAVTYQYDLSNLPVKITTQVKEEYGPPSEYLSSYSFYDGLGRVIEVKSPAQPDANGNQRQIISELAKYNARGKVIEKFLPYFVSASENFETPAYTTKHAHFLYDPVGRLIRVTNPDNSRSNTVYSVWTTVSYDANGHRKAVVSDAYGRVTAVYEYKGADGRSPDYPKETYSVYSTTLYQYDAMGNLAKIIDNTKKNITQIYYDSLGRKIKMDDPDMGVWLYEYDDLGNLKKQTDAKAQVLEFSYDDLNRLTSKQGLSPQGTVPVVLARYYYDNTSKGNCIGRLSKIIDLSGSTDFYYDKLGRETKAVKSVSGSGAFSVLRTYDALGRLVTLKYPDGLILQYAYCPQGIIKVSNITDSKNISDYVKAIEYSVTGQINKIAYGNGTSTDYAYDPNTLRLSNLTTTSPGAGKIQEFEYKFDSSGNVAFIGDYVHTATQSFDYDHLGRLITACGAYGTLNYEYDAIGNMINKEGVVLSYGKAGRLPHAVTQYGDTVIDYDASGNMVKKGSKELQYDVENRLSKVSDKVAETGVRIELSPGWNFISFPVVLADAKISTVFSGIIGDIVQVSRYNAAAAKFEHFINNSKYDQFNTFEYGKGYQVYYKGAQKTSITLGGKPPATIPSISLKKKYNFIFCPKVTPTAVEQALLPLKLGSHYSKVLCFDVASGKFKEYSAAKKDFTLLVPGNAYFVYCLNDTAWKPAASIVTTSFVYDGDGGRVKKVAPAGTTTYIGSLYEKESDGTARKHIFSGSNRIASVIAGPAQQGEAVSYFHSDHLGSSNIITDKDGKVVELSEYTPYGSFSKNEGSNPQTGPPNSHYFTGKELDPSTGLYFYGARYYDPQLGRFITADTIVQAPYDPQSLNRYSYCRNNPINYVDPSGHKWSWSKFWHAAVGVFVGVIATMVLGPGGALGWYGWTMAGAIGGATGGAITGGLEGGWRGALMGAAMGGITGGLGGWAYGGGHTLIMGGMFAAGAGVAGATDSWDSFAGGIAGGLAGAAVGSGINNSELVKNWKTGNDNKYHSGQPTNGTNDGNPNKALIIDKGKGASGIREIDDPAVRGEMLKAYNESLKTGSEQGGVVKRNELGGLSVDRYPQGNCNADGCTPIGWRPGGVADFHTHFHTLGPGQQDYSTAITTTNVHGLQHHYIVDSESIKSFTPTAPRKGEWEHVWRWDGN